MSYRQDLHDFICDSSHGMLLDADKYTAGDKPNPVFVTSSGRLQKQYVTLWELFDHPREFQECLLSLAAIAKEIRVKERFDVIVTCTSTAKHLMDHMQAFIDTSDDPIAWRYLGPYPYQDFFNWRLLDLKNTRVLILTDVVGFGALVKNLCAVVRRLGGMPVAILSVVRLVNDQASLNCLLKTDLFQDLERIEPDKTPLFALTGVAIPDVPAAANLDPITIDPRTVLPQEEGEPGPQKALFSDEEALEHFEASGAIRFGIHEVEGSRFTTAVSFSKLLAAKSGEIWKRLGPKIPSRSIVATTLAKDDHQILEFITDRLTEDGRPLQKVMIPRVDSLGTDFTQYFLTPSTGLDGAHVTLILAAVRSLEKLTMLASLLLQEGIRGLTLVAMLDRMGDRAADFMTRIKALLSGIKKEVELTETDFTFVSVYSLSDFDSDDLSRAQQHVENLAEDFRAHTRVAGFRTLMQRELHYFRPEPVSGRAFEEGTAKRLENPVELSFARRGKEPTVTVSTEDGLLFLYCARAVRYKQYEPLIELLGQARDRAPLYRLISILVGAISYLRSSRQFRILRQKLVDLLASAAGRQSELEAHYIFSLALVSYLDVGELKVYEDLVGKLLENGAGTSSIVTYWRDERIAWTISFLLHVTQHSYRLSDDTPAFLEEIRTKVVHLRSAADDPNEDNKYAAIQNLNALLTEFGQHPQMAKHEVLRYLQIQLLRYKARHNPVFKALERAKTALEALLLDEGGQPMPLARIGADDRNVKQALDSAIYAAGALEDIAQSVKRLFQMHSGGDSIEAILNLCKRTVPLRELLVNIRDSGRVLASEQKNVQEHLDALKNGFTREDQAVVRSLQYYVVPIESTLVSAMSEAQSYLVNQKNIQGAWPPGAIPPGLKNRHVLMDSLSLQEIFWNILTNVRHAGIRRFRPSKRPLISFTNGDSQEDPGTKYLTVCIRSHKPVNFTLPGPLSTFAKHQGEVRLHGGDLSISSSGAWVSVVLKLIARDDLVSTFEESKPRGKDTIQ